MNYDIRILNREEQQAVHKLLLYGWKPVGETVDEVVAKLNSRFDTDWITEYLAYHDTRERKANDC